MRAVLPDSAPTDSASATYHSGPIILTMAKVKVQRERRYAPHHTLLGAASMNLDLAKEKQDGWFYFEMAAMLFSGLALEALAHAFGSHFVPSWRDFESASPVAKLRIVCDTLEIDYNAESEPWSSARWLISFRNKLAHAKPEDIDVTEIMDLHAWEARWPTDRPDSKLEKEVTLGNAERAVEAANAIKLLFCGKLSGRDVRGLAVESWATGATVIVDPSQPG